MAVVKNGMITNSFKEYGGINIREESVKIDTYADSFLSDIGASHIDSLDYSEFEGCSVVRDLNIKFSGDSRNDNIKEKYDIVLDFGTSEHIFNPSISIANSIFMLKNGGGLVLVLPVVGWIEHGFYQFSPNFFRSLEVDGLLLKRLYIFNPYSEPLMIWDGKDLINITLYESMSGRFSSFAVYEKTKIFSEDLFLTKINQGVYLKSWKKDTKKTNKKERIGIKRLIRTIFSEFKFYKYLVLLKHRISIDNIIGID